MILLWVTKHTNDEQIRLTFYYSVLKSTIIVTFKSISRTCAPTCPAVFAIHLLSQKIRTTKAIFHEQKALLRRFPTSRKTWQQNVY